MLNYEVLQFAKRFMVAMNKRYGVSQDRNNTISLIDLALKGDKKAHSKLIALHS